MYVEISEEQRNEYLLHAATLPAGEHIVQEYQDHHNRIIEVVRIPGVTATGIAWYCPIQGKLYGACRCEQTENQQETVQRWIRFDVRTLEDTVQSLRVIVDDTGDWMREHGALDQARDDVRTSIMRSAVIAAAAHADDIKRKHKPEVEKKHEFRGP